MLFATLSRHRSLDVDFLVGVDAYTATSGGEGGREEGTGRLVALDDDVAGLTDHFRMVVDHVLVAVDTRVFCNLTDASGSHLQLSALTGCLHTHVGTSHHDGRTTGEEGPVAVYVADDDLRCREHQSVIVAHVTASLSLDLHLKLHLLDLGLTLPDFVQVFLNAVGKVR